MQEYVLRLFAGGYNTLYDSATSWIEPTEKALEAAVDELSDQGIEISEEEFKDFFNAWMLYRPFFKVYERQLADAER